MEHIQRISGRYIVLLNVIIICVPVGTVLFWVFFNSLTEGFLANLPVQPAHDLSAVQIALALLITLIPMSVSLYALVTLKALFSLYAEGQIFTIDNVKCLRRLGQTLIAWVIASALYTPLISAVMSFGNAPGERAVVAEFGIVDVTTLLIGGVTLIIASVMNQGCELESEQAYTI